MASVISSRPINPAFLGGSSLSDLGFDLDPILIDSVLSLSSAKRGEHLASMNFTQLRGGMAGYLKTFSLTRGDDSVIDEALTKMERTKKQIAAIQEYSSILRTWICEVVGLSVTLLLL